MTTTQIPGSIVKAVCAVMANLENVKKSQKNQHGGYMFASTDDIYAAVTRKMGEVGLMILALEDEVEISRAEKDGKTSQWMKATFAFILATGDATWADPKAKRTIIVQVTGPQTFQAAQSYAEKAYLRSLFKIPTGDMDLDSLPENYEYAPIVFKSREPAAVPPPAPIEKKEEAAPPVAPVEESVEPQTEANAEFFLENLGLNLAACKHPSEVEEVWDENEDIIGALPMQQREQASDLYQRHSFRVAPKRNDKPKQAVK